MPEAAITINGEPLTNEDARLVRIALETLYSTLAHQLGFAHTRLPITDAYLEDLKRLQAQLGGPPQPTAGDPAKTHRTVSCPQSTGINVWTTRDSSQ